MKQQEKGAGKVTNIAGALTERGFVYDAVGDPQHFLSEKRTVYLGMDPTAESLQVGNLVPIFLLKHLADAGHTVIFLVGEGTGMIGDPRASGERVLLDSKTVAKNTKAIQKQLTTIFGKKKYAIVNNATWLAKLSLVDFLRDTAKHFTVNQLIKREIIKKRLDDENDSISFTEFSYSLLQGYDFWHLNKTKGVDMQIGGSDQWANLLSGVELIRRREGKTAYVLSNPLIIDKKTGKKFGKSEGNAIWLDPHQTSSYAFYQFWLNVSDEGVEEYLKIFTFLPLQDIARIMVLHTEKPQERGAQKRLAFEITKMIHEEKNAESAARVSAVLFGEGALASLSKGDFAYLQKEVPMTKIIDGTAVIDALVALELASSKGEARRLIEQKGISLNEVAVTDVQAVLSAGDFLNGIAQVRRGRRVGLLAREGRKGKK